MAGPILTLRISIMGVCRRSRLVGKERDQCPTGGGQYASTRPARRKLVKVESVSFLGMIADVSPEFPDPAARIPKPAVSPSRRHEVFVG